MSEPRSVFDAVRTMLAVRSYQTKLVPSAIVRRIIEAGRLTASASNTQPWHFIVVEDRETLGKLGRIASTGPYVASAPMAIVVGVDKESPLGVSDGSRAIQSMMLTAWEDGVGSNWIGFRGMEPVRKLLGMPANFDVLAIVAFGYPATRVSGSKKRRKPLEQVASRERFGQPLG